MKVHKGDTVLVVSGKDKGAKGKVIEAFPTRDKILVEGVNRITRHVKPGPQGTGGLVVQEAPIHVSNVAIVDPSDKKPTRVKTRVEQVERDGRTKTTRVRVSVRSGKDI